MSGNNRQAIAKKEPNVVQRLFRETVGELRKVSWPTRRETLNLSWVVLGVLISMAAIMGLLDSGLTWVVAQLVR
ncbi:MAG: hypothetical protein Fur0018_25080 [Anaerolineales bacterium]